MGKRIRVVLGYLFGGSFALVGVVGLVDDPLASIVFLLMAVLLFPPSIRWIQKKIGRPVPITAKTIAIFGLILLAGIIADSKAEQQLQATIADQRTRFSEGRDSILAEVEVLIAKGQYQQALQVTASFEFVEDSILNSLKVRAEAQKAEAAAQEREHELVALVATIPASQTKRNMDIYHELMELDPENQRYTDKYDHYRDIYERAQERQRERRAFLGERPIASAWDGTYREVDDYLQSVARDPESVEVEQCTPVYVVDAGWLVGCEWRARNGFGGMNRTANWFVIRQGRVIRMEPLNAYTVE